MRRSYYSFTCISLISLIFLFSINNVSADKEDGLPIIGEDDSYVVNASIGSTHVFNWTIYRNSTQNFVVRIDVNGLNSWDYHVSHDYFVLDEIHPYQIVGLSVEIPQYPEAKEKQGIVTFTFRALNQTETFSFDQSIGITVTGLSDSRENTIVGGFQNPLPYPLNNQIGAFILNIGI